MLRSMAFPDDCTTCGAVATTSTQHKLHTQRIVVVTKAQELFQRFFVDPERKQPLNLLRTTIRTLIQPSDRSEVNCFANQPHAVRLFTIQSPDELYGSSLSSPSPQEASQPFGHGNGDILLPNVERRTSNVERRTSNVERRTSNVERRKRNERMHETKQDVLSIHCATVKCPRMWSSVLLRVDLHCDITSVDSF